MNLPVGTVLLQPVQNRQNHMTNKTGNILICKSFKNGKEKCPNTGTGKRVLQAIWPELSARKGAVIAA